MLECFHNYFKWFNPFHTKPSDIVPDFNYKILVLKFHQNYTLIYVPSNNLITNILLYSLFCKLKKKNKGNLFYFMAMKRFDN